MGYKSYSSCPLIRFNRLTWLFEAHTNGRHVLYIGTLVNTASSVPEIQHYQITLIVHRVVIFLAPITWLRDLVTYYDITSYRILERPCEHNLATVILEHTCIFCYRQQFSFQVNSTHCSPSSRLPNWQSKPMREFNLYKWPMGESGGQTISELLTKLASESGRDSLFTCWGANFTLQLWIATETTLGKQKYDKLQLRLITYSCFRKIIMNGGMTLLETQIKSLQWKIL